MADMTLVLDVVSNVDYSKIEAEVQKIRNSLSKIPDKVKINVDVGIDKSAAQRIQNLQRDIENAVNMNGATASVKGAAGNINAMSKSISDMGKNSSYALRDQVDAITGVNNASKSAKDSADAMRMAWAMAKQEASANADAAKALADSETQQSESASKASYALRDQVDAITGVNNASKSAKDSADAMRMAWAMAKQEASANADAIREYTNGINTLSTAEKNLKNWSKMGVSKNTEANDAYIYFQQAVVGLRKARAEYDGTAESANNLSDAALRVSDAMQKADAVGYKTGTLSSTLKAKMFGVVGQLGAMASGIRGIQLAIRGVKYLVNEATAIDDSMTQLRIVTNESDETFKKYGEDVAKTAQKIGSSITDVIDAATVFARLGYSLSDSSTLAELTAMLQRVGDIDAGDAQSSLTSIIKAFDIDVSDMELVMDKLVTVGNGFPISVSEIATGMMNASSALAAAGNSFDKSVALIAAANTTLQDANKASTGLRTITARIRKTDSELDDLGEAMTQSAYEDLVGALTKYNVALRDSNGEYRDTYDIMQDIAAVWDTMTSSEQAALAELAAGNRQQTVFYSIIKNFDDVAKKSMEAMSNSPGAMQDAYSEWMDSITAHVETLKAAFQGLSNDLVSNDLLKGFVDFGTTVVNITDGVVRWNDNLAKLTVTLGTIVTLFSSIKSIS